MKHNKQYNALKTFLKRYKIDWNEFQVEELPDSVVLTYKGEKLLLKSRAIMTTDTMAEWYGTNLMYYLPEFSYQVLDWLYEKGYRNPLFKVSRSGNYMRCALCSEHYNFASVAGFIVTTKNGAEPMCPEHAINYPLKHIVIYEEGVV